MPALLGAASWAFALGVLPVLGLALCAGARGSVGHRGRHARRGGALLIAGWLLLAVDGCPQDLTSGRRPRRRPPIRPAGSLGKSSGRVGFGGPGLSCPSRPPSSCRCTCVGQKVLARACRRGRSFITRARRDRCLARGPARRVSEPAGLSGRPAGGARETKNVRLGDPEVGALPVRVGGRVRRPVRAYSARHARRAARRWRQLSRAWARPVLRPVARLVGDRRAGMVSRRLMMVLRLRSTAPDVAVPHEMLRMTHTQMACGGDGRSGGGRNAAIARADGSGRAAGSPAGAHRQKRLRASPP